MREAVAHNSWIRQVRFLTPFVAQQFFEMAVEETLAGALRELRLLLTHGSVNAGGLFEDWALCFLAQHGFRGDIVVLRRGAGGVVGNMKLPAFKKIRHFLDAKHLSRLVADDLALGFGLSLYVPLAANNPLVDAFCVGTIATNNKKARAARVVVGLQMTVAKKSHPITGEATTKAQFEAIRKALEDANYRTAKAAWLLFVLPAGNFDLFPFQNDNNGNAPGTVWPHTQAKLAVNLDDLGNGPKNVGQLRNMIAHSTIIELTTATVDELTGLYNIGPETAKPLAAKVREERLGANADAATFLASVGPHLGDVLQLPQNIGRWAFNGSLLAPRPRQGRCHHECIIVFHVQRRAAFR